MYAIILPPYNAISGKVSGGASILITVRYRAHDSSVRDRAGEIGIPFTPGMRITLAVGRGFRRNRDQISRAFQRDDCRVLYWVLPRTALITADHDVKTSGAIFDREHVLERGSSHSSPPYYREFNVIAASRSHRNRAVINGIASSRMDVNICSARLSQYRFFSNTEILIFTLLR